MSMEAKTGQNNISDGESAKVNSVIKGSSTLKKLFENPLIKYTVICSAVFALIIHVLFSFTAPCDFLEHEWEAGDILTYVSTIALGVLAVWQNQKFKEENDKAQTRLEKLTIQANELSVINKIIEYETSNYKELQKAIQTFEKALDFYPTMTELHQKGKTETEREIVFITESHRIKLAAQELWDVIDDDIRLSDEEKDTIEKALDEIVEAADKVIDAIHAELSNPEDHSFAGALSNFEATFTVCRQEIIRHQTKAKVKYEKLIYGNMSLKEIKELYCYQAKEAK